MWHDQAYAYRSLSDGRLPVSRGGYSFAAAKEPALYVDLDGSTLEANLKMCESSIATFYKGESNIQRILILDRKLADDKASVTMTFIRIGSTPAFLSNDGPAFAIDGKSPIHQQVWDKTFLKNNRVFVGIWM